MPLKINRPYIKCELFSSTYKLRSKGLVTAITLKKYTSNISSTPICTICYHG